MYAPIFPPMIGGPATQCFHLCSELYKRGEKPVVLTVGKRFECASPDGYPVYRYPWSYTRTPLDKVLRWIVFPFYFLRVLKKEKPDIVHCHSVSVLSFIVGWITKRRDIPSVIKFAGDWVWETLSTYRLKAYDFEDLHTHSATARCMWRIEKWGLSLFDMIWVPSEFRAQNVEKILGYRPPNMRMIYNALGLKGGGYREIDVHEPFVVVSASRFIPHKRIPALIHAFAKLEDSRARLILIGTGEVAEITKAKEAAEVAHAESQVLFTGRIEEDEKNNYFKNASVYVSNSLEEGFPNVFVEAMHFGLPIISTNVGGCHEIVKEGETGYLFEVNDEATLVERLKALKDQPSLRNRLAKSAYEHSHQYELAVVLKQFMDLYRDTLALNQK